MAHPFQSHRADTVAHERVGKILADKARGGSVHTDEAEDRKLVKSMVKAADLKTSAKKAKSRPDRLHRAAGGRTNKRNAKTAINIMIAPQDHGAAQMHPMPIPVPAGPPPGPPPAPPMPPSGAPPGAMGRPVQTMPGMMGMPGANAMPLRAKGGRVKKDDGGEVSKPTVIGQNADGSKIYGTGDSDGAWSQARRVGGRVKKDSGGSVGADSTNEQGALANQIEAQDAVAAANAKRGGKVTKRASGGGVWGKDGPGGYDAKDGAGWKEGRKAGTQVSHTPGKGDLDDIKSKPALLVRKDGGKVGPDRVHKYPTMKAGARGGMGRLQKIANQKRTYPG